MSKERLVELIAVARNDYYDYSDEIHENGMSVDESSEEYIADYLLANGVIVPPCKVGDIVYEIVQGEISETEAVGFLVCQDGAILLITKHFFPLSREIGETVFLTREKAVEKLKESESK